MGRLSFIGKIMPKTYRKLIKIKDSFVYSARMYYYTIKYCLRFESVNSYNIPIIINNYNRYSFLKCLIKSLEQRGYYNIHVIDNNSTYLPLLEYYNNLPYPVYRLKENIGYCALWQTDIFSKFKNSYYVYTDSDLRIDDDCPNDFMKYFLSILKHHPTCEKVGFGLHIDDIPDCYNFKKDVIKHESQFWSQKLSDNIYRACIDTTFALYKPYTYGPADELHFNIRTGSPFMMRHLPWYVDSNSLSDEERYYVSNSRQSTHWTQKLKGRI